MRHFSILAVCLVVASVPGQVARAEEERYTFPELRWEFIIIGDQRREVLTPAGRKLVADGEIQDIRRYGDDVYLVDQYFIRRYDPTQDWAAGEKRLEEVFRFFYQAPLQHEIQGQLCWTSRSQWYYPVYWRAHKERPPEQQTIVFRGLVRIYPLPQETRVQYLPYTRLPEEGQWLAPRYFQQPDFLLRRRLVTLELENTATSEKRRISLNEKDEFIEPDQSP